MDANRADPDTFGPKSKTPMTIEERLYDKIEKLQERVSKLERDQFVRHKAEQEHQKLKDQLKAGLKTSSESYIQLNARVENLANELNDILDDLADLRNGGGTNTGHLATAPTAESWEMSKQAADLIDSRAKAAMRDRLRQQDLDDIANLPSAQAPTGAQPAQASQPPNTITPSHGNAQTHTTAFPGRKHEQQRRDRAGRNKDSSGDSITSEEDVEMGDQEGVVIPDSQQNAQTMNYAIPLVDYTSDD